MRKSKNHERIKKLIELFDLNGKWLNDDEAFELFGVKNFSTRLHSGTIVIIKENFIELDLRGFFEDTKIHKKSLILLEFFNNKKRYPKKGEKYKGVNLYCFAENIKYKKGSNLSSKDYEQITSNKYFNPKRKEI